MAYPATCEVFHKKTRGRAPGLLSTLRHRIDTFFVPLYPGQPDAGPGPFPHTFVCGETALVKTLRPDAFDYERQKALHAPHGVNGQSRKSFPAGLSFAKDIGSGAKPGDTYSQAVTKKSHFANFTMRETGARCGFISHILPDLGYMVQPSQDTKATINKILPIFYKG